MAKISVRKLFLFGRYSLALLLPKKWLRELGVEAGESVQLEFDQTRRRIVIRLATSPTFAPKKPGDKPTRLTKKSSDPSWSPIPRL